MLPAKADILLRLVDCAVHITGEDARELAVASWSLHVLGKLAARFPSVRLFLKPHGNSLCELLARLGSSLSNGVDDTSVTFLANSTGLRHRFYLTANRDEFIMDGIVLLLNLLSTMQCDASLSSDEAKHFATAVCWAISKGPLLRSVVYTCATFRGMLSMSCWASLYSRVEASTNDPNRGLPRQYIDLNILSIMSADFVECWDLAMLCGDELLKVGNARLFRSFYLDAYLSLCRGVACEQYKGSNDRLPITLLTAMVHLLSHAAGLPAGQPREACLRHLFA